jgi:hypothetical protein
LSRSKTEERLTLRAKPILFIKLLIAFLTPATIGTELFAALAIMTKETDSLWVNDHTALRTSIIIFINKEPIPFFIPTTLNIPEVMLYFSAIKLR